MDINIENGQSYRYDAFISYRHTFRDKLIAEKLHKLLETYRTPNHLVNQGALPRINRVFRDREELPTSSNLSKDINEALQQSRYLIVVCSPDTPKSQWVNKEIMLFRELYGSDRILALLVDGEPEESFPGSLISERTVVKNIDGVPHAITDVAEPLAADIRAGSLKGSLKLLKTEKLRLLASILGCKFDDLKQRQRERQIRRWALAGSLLATFLVIFGLYNYAQLQSVIAANKKAEEALSQAIQANNEKEIALKNEKKAKEIALLNEEEARKQQQIAEYERDNANSQRKRAEENQQIAEENQQIAEYNRELADYERDNALIGQSVYLADMSRQQVENGNRMMGIMLALQALPKDMNNPERPYVADAEWALYNALYQRSFTGTAVLNCNDSVNMAKYSSDGSKILTVSDDRTIRIWDAYTGKLDVLLKHEGSVNWAEFSPDGKRVVTGCGDGAARVWDASTGRELFTLAHDGIINLAKFSADGKRILTILSNEKVLVWNAETGELISTIYGNQDNETVFIMFYAEFSPDGKKVVTASNDDTARIWDADTGKQLLLLDKHSDNYSKFMRYARFSPDGKKVITASDDKTARIWNADTGEQLLVLDKHTDSVRYAEFSPDGTMALTTSFDYTAMVWDTATGKQLAVLKHKSINASGQGSYINSARFSPNSKMIVTSSNDHTAMIWEVDGFYLLTLEKHTAPVEYAEFSPDSMGVVTASNDKSAIIWSLVSGERKVELNDSSAGVNNESPMGFSTDGSKVFTRSYLGLQMWNSDTGEQLASLKNDGDKKYMAFSPDGSKAVMFSVNTAVIFSTYTGKQLTVLSGHTGLVDQAVFSPDGTKILTASSDGTARVWDTGTGKQLFIMSHGSVRILHEYSYEPETYLEPITIEAGALLYPGIVMFSPDGSRILTTYRDRTAVIWDAVTGSQVSMIKYTTSSDNEFIKSADFSPNSSKIVICISYSPDAFVWDTDTGRNIMTLKGHTSDVEMVKFSPDGKYIATASRDKTARIWDTRTGSELFVLDRHDDTVRYLEFSPDSSKLLTILFGSSVATIFDVESGVQIAVLGDKVNSAAFSPDSTKLLVNSENDYVTYTRFPNHHIGYNNDCKVYSFFFHSTQEAIDYANEVLNGRELTPDERREFSLDI